MSKELYMLAAFLEDVDQMSYTFEEASEKNVWSKLLKQSDEELPKIEINTKYLSELTDVAVSLKSQALNAVQFFQKNKDVIVAKNLKVSNHQPFDIKSINANVLANYVKKTEQLFSHLSEKKADKKDVDAFINDPNNIADFKSRIVFIENGLYYTSKDVLTFDNLAERDLTANYIQNYTIPFLQEFARVKCDPFTGKEDKDWNLQRTTFANLAKLVKKSIERNYKELLLVERSAVNSGLREDIVTRVMYAAKSNFIELSKYLVAGAMKYMTEWITDVRMYINLAERLSDSLAISTVDDTVKAEFESAGMTMDNCSILQAEILVSAAQKLISDLNVNPTDPENMELDVDEAEDKRAYQLILKMLEAYRDQLINATGFYEENIHRVSVELLLRRFNLFSEDFWKTINGERSVNDKFLRSVNYNYACVKTDLENMKEYSVKICQLYKENMSILDKFIQLVKSGKSNDYSTDGETFTMDNLEEKKAELLGKLEDLYSSFELASRELMKAYIKRLSGIDLAIHQELGSTNSFVPDTHDYFIDVFNANYDMVVESHEERLKDMFAFYESEYMNSLADTSDVFMEADNNQQPQNGNNANNNQGNNNPKNNQKNQQQPAQNTSPKVEDNSNNNQTQQNADGNNVKQSTQNILSRIKKFISGIIDKILGFFNKNHMKEKNLKFINTYKEYLINRNYSNITIHILPYQESNYVKWCSNVVQKASTLKPNQLKNMNEDQMYSFLYSGIGAYSKVKANTNAERFEQAIKLGTLPNQTVAWSNGRIKQEVPKMIQYVENYYNKIEADLKNLDGSMNQLTNLDVVTSSEGNTQTNLTLVPRIINESIGSAINVSRKRANDYMIILNSLVPDAQKKKQQEQDNNQANGQNNDQNQ
jgi:hypothetical protein